MCGALHVWGVVQASTEERPAPRGSRTGQSRQMLDSGVDPNATLIARHVRWCEVRRRLLLFAVIRWPVVAHLHGVGAQFGQHIRVEGGARLGLVDLDLHISKESPK